MSKRFSFPILICLLLMSFNICLIACSSKKEKDTEVNTPSKDEVSKTVFQPASPVVEDAKMEPEKPIQSIEGNETKSESISPKTKQPDTTPGDKTLPAKIVLFSPLWEAHTRGPVGFTHKNHIKIHKVGCNKCHHIYEQGENIWNEKMPVEKCEVCHNELTVKGERKLPPDVKKKNLKLAFHDNCRACHKELRKENPETKAPTKCSQCHEKK